VVVLEGADEDEEGRDEAAGPAFASDAVDDDDVVGVFW